MAAAVEPAQQSTPFSWEESPPSGPFWDDLIASEAPPLWYLKQAGQAFLRIFSTEEIDAMNLNPTLPTSGKITLLEGIFKNKIAAIQTGVDDPAKLNDDAWKKFKQCYYCLECLESSCGNFEKSLQFSQLIVDATKRRAPNKPDFGLYNNAYTLKRLGRNAEAEAAAREILPAMRDSEVLGPDSPQVLGTLRLLMEVIAKQGREQEAMDLNKEGWSTIELLKKGKFAKYESEEIEAMQEVKDDIPKWANGE